MTKATSTRRDLCVKTSVRGRVIRVGTRSSPGARDGPVPELRTSVDLLKWKIRFKKFSHRVVIFLLLQERRDHYL